MTVNDLTADVSAVSFVVALTTSAPPGEVGTTNVVVNAPFASVSAHARIVVEAPKVIVAL